MVRASAATTFSSSPYFDDRGVHGHAKPITERIHVSNAHPHPSMNITVVKPHSRPIVSYYFPEGIGEYHYGVSTLPVVDLGDFFS